MGIEDKLKGFSQTDAAEILKRLKDGNLSDKDVKELKEKGVNLTAEEQAALNAAFSSGEVRVGDYVMVNKGKSVDGKKQYTETKHLTKKPKQEEKGFWGKAWDGVKDFVSDHPVVTAGATALAAFGAYKAAAALGFSFGGPLGAAIALGGVFLLTSCDRGDIYQEQTNTTNLSGMAEAIQALAKQGASGTQQIVNAINNGVTTLNTSINGVSQQIQLTNDFLHDYVKELLTQIKNNTGSTASNTAAMKDSLATVVNTLLNSDKTLTDIKNILGDNFGDIISILREELPGWMVDVADSVNQNNNNNTERVIEEIRAIKEGIDGLQELIRQLPNNIGSQLKGDLTNILNAVKAGNQSLEYLNRLVEDIKGQVEKILQNQEFNNGQNDAIIGILRQISNIDTANGEALKELVQIVKNIDLTTQNIDANIEEMLAQIKTYLPDIGFKLDKLQEKANEIGVNTAQINNFTQQIFELMRQFHSDFKGFTTQQQNNFSTLINNVIANGGKIDDVSALLKELKQTMINEGEANRAQAQELADAVIAAINQLGVDVSGSMEAILSAVNMGNATLAEIKDMVANLGTLVKNYGESGKNYGKAILEAIRQGNCSLQSMENLLGCVNNNVVDGNEQNKIAYNNILSALSKLNFNMVDGIDNIVEDIVVNGQNVDTKLNQIAGILNDIEVIEKANGDKLDKANELSQEIIDAINNLGIEYASHVDYIVDAVKNNKIDLSKAEQLLENINASVNQNTTVGKAYGKAILEAIEKLGTASAAGIATLTQAVRDNKISTAQLEKLLSNLTAQNKSYSEKILAAIDKLGADSAAGMIAITEAVNAKKVDVTTIENMLATLTAQNKSYGDAVLAAIGKLGGDFANNMAKLVAAVKENKVDLTKVENLLTNIQDGGKAYAEAILDKLDKLGYEFTGSIANLTQAVKEKKISTEQLEKLLTNLTAQNKSYSEKILAAIDKLGADSAAGMIAITEAVNAKKVDVTTIENMLATLTAQNKSYGDAVLAAIGKLGGDFADNMAKLVAAVKENKVDLTKVENLLTNIQDGGKAYAEAILDKLDKIGYEFTGSIANLTQAVKDNKISTAQLEKLLTNLTEQNKTYSEKILAAIDKYGADVVVGMTVITDAVKANKVDTKTIEKLIATLTEQNKSYGDAILKAIGNLGAISGGGSGTVIVDLTELVEAVKANKVDLSKLEGLVQQVNTNVETYGKKGTQIANQILETNRDILAAIKALTGKVDEVGKQTINTIVAKADEILEKMDKLSVSNPGTGSNLEAMLAEVLKRMDKIDNTNKQGFIDVIDAIGKLADTIAKLNVPSGKDYEQYLQVIISKLDAGNVSIEGVKQEVEGLADLIKTVNNNVIKNANLNEKILKVTEDILAEIKTINPNMTAGFNVVVNAFKDGNAAQLAKLEKILQKLEEMDSNRKQEASAILAAIKDHDVNVTVDPVSVEVTCTCNCQCGADGKTHEGIINQVQDLLNG